MRTARRSPRSARNEPTRIDGQEPGALLFTQPSRAIAAIKLLVDSGTPVLRLSIQTWGSGIAIRARDPIDSVCRDQLLALGGEPVTGLGSRLSDTQGSEAGDACPSAFSAGPSEFAVRG